MNVFGYGSLVWRPALPFEQRRPARIRGWTRRFWQSSPDHRGTPEAPGRVVTLVPAEGADCWGMLYRVAAADAPTVVASLDHREKAGYERHRLPAWLADGSCVEGVLVYVAGPDNPDFIGPAPLAEMVEHVLRSVGPSGPNPEYVLHLAQALREMGAEDPHVFALADAVEAAVEAALD